MDQPERARHHQDLDWAAMVAFAELEAEILMPFLIEATSVLADRCEHAGLSVRRILDVGSGPGVGTCVLAEQFSSADVVAVDGSTEMLASVSARAGRLGVSSRVTTRLIEVPQGLDSLGRADLVWASMVLHHVGDEAAALHGLRARLEPGGLVALAEFGNPLRVIPADADAPEGVWRRLDAAGRDWLADMRSGLSGATASADYPTMLEAADFDVLVDRMMTVHLDAPLGDGARRVALGHLKLMREHVVPYARAEDLAFLDLLTGENDAAGIMRRPDALLHASRRLVIARAEPVPSGPGVPPGNGAW